MYRSARTSWSNIYSLPIPKKNNKKNENKDKNIKRREREKELEQEEYNSRTLILVNGEVPSLVTSSIYWNLNRYYYYFIDNVILLLFNSILFSS